MTKHLDHDQTELSLVPVSTRVSFFQLFNF